MAIQSTLLLGTDNDDKHCKKHKGIDKESKICKNY